MRSGPRARGGFPPAAPRVPLSAVPCEEDALFFDAHAHLDLSPLGEAEEEVVRRARDAGVTRILSVGTDVGDCRRALKDFRRAHPLR